ncbi:unnamed protein product [Dicrocoelium dendriticum]|nr:unnamed protein product [Dicrocoelium dendriticum]
MLQFLNQIRAMFPLFKTPKLRNGFMQFTTPTLLVYPFFHKIGQRRRENICLFEQIQFNLVVEVLFNSTTVEDQIRLITLISTGDLENASRLFFRPELSTFKANLENGSMQLTVYVPPLLRKAIFPLTSPASVASQSFFWLYPKRGMRSLMYAYDQYQQNFDLVQRFGTWMPPYGDHDFPNLITMMQLASHFYLGASKESINLT